MTLFDKAVQIKGTPDADILCTLTLPYTIPNPRGIFMDAGQKSEFPAVYHDDENRRRFASIHSNPPGIRTDRPAIMRQKYGKGEVIWACAPFEKADRPQHKAIFSRLIKSLAKNNLHFHSDGPDPVELILFDVPELQQKLIGLINLQESFNTLPVYDFSISILSILPPKTVTRLFDNQAVNFEYSNQQVILHIDKLNQAQMFMLQF